jgi:hypothetical protein
MRVATPPGLGSRLGAIDQRRSGSWPARVLHDRRAGNPRGGFHLSWPSEPPPSGGPHVPRLPPATPPAVSDSSHPTAPRQPPHTRLRPTHPQGGTERLRRSWVGSPATPGRQDQVGCSDRQIGPGSPRRAAHQFPITLRTRRGEISTKGRGLRTGTGAQGTSWNRPPEWSHEGLLHSSDQPGSVTPGGLPPYEPCGAPGPSRDVGTYDPAQAGQGRMGERGGKLAQFPV